MANEDIVFKASIDGASGAKSLTDLKKEFKELQSELSKTTEGTKEYTKVLQRMGKVKDEMGDLRDTINALNPEGKIGAFTNVAGKLAGGFQAATGAAALLGVQSEDLEKTLLKVQAATAFAEGIRSLSGLSDAFAIVGTVIKTQVITALSTLKGALIATGIGAAAVALGVLIVKAQEYNEEIEESYNKQKKFNEALAEATEGYLKAAAASEELRNRRKGGLNELERELKLLEAQGATAEEVSKKKQEVLAAEIYNLKVVRATVFDNAVEVAKLNEKIKDKETELQSIKLANEKRLRDEYAKTRDERIKAAVEAHNRNADVMNREIDAEEARQKEAKEKQRIADEEEFQRIFDGLWRKQLADEDLQKRNEEFMVGFQQREAARLDEKVQKEKEAAELIAGYKMQAEQKSFDAAKNLSDLFFTLQFNKAQGNAKKELEIRKRQFQVEKAFNAVRATIDGFRAVNAALTIPPPWGPILAGINAIASGAMVAKILSSKFDGGNASFDNISAGSVASAPNIQTQAPQIQPTTRLNEQGQVTGRTEPIRAYVVETEQTSAQMRVKRLEDQATFG